MYSFLNIFILKKSNIGLEAAVLLAPNLIPFIHPRSLYHIDVVDWDCGQIRIYFFFGLLLHSDWYCKFPI